VTGGEADFFYRRLDYLASPKVKTSLPLEGGSGGGLVASLSVGSRPCLHLTFGDGGRRHPDLNWGIEDLQSSALPLGYTAEGDLNMTLYH